MTRVRGLCLLPTKAKWRDGIRRSSGCAAEGGGAGVSGSCGVGGQEV